MITLIPQKAIGEIHEINACGEKCNALQPKILKLKYNCKLSHINYIIILLNNNFINLFYIILIIQKLHIFK